MERKIKMDNKQLTNKDFFFCYNRDIYFYLIQNGLDFITIAKEPKNDKMFSLFYRSDKLESLLSEYNNSEKKVKQITQISNH